MVRNTYIYPPESSMRIIADVIDYTARQAVIDKGENVVIGVNRYRLENENTVNILEIDNSKDGLPRSFVLKR